MQRRLQHPAHRCGRAHADGVAHGNFIAAHLVQLTGHSGDFAGRHLALVGTADHAGDIAAHFYLVARGSGHNRLETLNALGHGTVDILVTEGLRGRRKNRHLGDTAGQRPVVPLQIGCQRRVGDAGPALNLLQYLIATGHLWHPLRIHKTAGFNIGHPRPGELVNQRQFGLRRDRLLFIL